MTKKELCPECQKEDKCKFETEANKIAGNIVEKGNPALSLSTALEAHCKIAKARIEARKRACPNLNNIDPDYPGKKYL
jgi:hypothetical protein